MSFEQILHKGEYMLEDSDQIIFDICKQMQTHHKVGLNSDSIEFLFMQYLREVWISECPPSGLDEGETSEVLMDILEFQNRKVPLNVRIYKRLKPHYQDVIELTKHATVITNLINTSHYLFGLSFDKFLNQPLTIELIKNIHAQITYQLLDYDDCGEFRKVEVQPKLSALIYCPKR